LVHEMSLRQKGTYAPPQDKARGLNIHDGKWDFGPIWSIRSIQPQIKHNQATKTCQDHIKAFTHKRAYTWQFSKTAPSTMDINHDYQELSQTNHSLPNKLIKT
jgi:hypothetical protein